MMTHLLLVRHAQASFGTDDYDRLSDHGHRQANLLGSWLAAQPWRYTSIHAGNQRRHVQTLEALYAAAAAAQRVLPAMMVDADWNEFDHECLLRGYRAFAPDDPDLESLDHPLPTARG
ncbi:histidine phosphatase family protein [Tahibacter amnicola]|uniref:Histidine phosphatase family protein n=1 Tax=Tahibacter amnicola TaxID=2976241 RepID=A0ABY6BIC8_9GAMM|nr:histidine phosphatase family protein [Tahibacter amnicola]UXI69346.1 histidine phosphatase family protein [Tahibacter amnicola]